MDRQLGMVQLLLQHGADIDALKDGGQTALAIAEQYDHQEVADVLRQHGATRLKGA